MKATWKVAKDHLISPGSKIGQASLTSGSVELRLIPKSSESFISRIIGSNFCARLAYVAASDWFHIIRSRSWLEAGMIGGFNLFECVIATVGPG